jgi:type II secretory pathway pseudopilin PulG
MNRRPRAAFTLVEVLLGLVVAAMLMGAISSVMILATQAMPDRNRPMDSALEAYRVVEQAASELYAAVTFVSHSAKVVEFTVADRDIDGDTETIRYAWSGTAGDPLTRQYNGGTVVNVAENVHDWQLNYVYEVRGEPQAKTILESSETLLASRDTVIDLKDFAIQDTQWISQYFSPTLPPDSTEWSVTTVRVLARFHGSQKGIVSAQLRLPDLTNLPGSTILESVPMDETALSASYTWFPLAFTDVSGLAPSQSLCLVLAMQKSDTYLADVQYDAKSGSGMAITTNAGVLWLPQALGSLRFYVYGKVKSITQPPPITRQWVTRMSLILQVGSDSTGRAETGVQILNRPEV